MRCLSSPGLEYQHVISIDPGLSSDGYSPAKAQAYLDTLRGRLAPFPASNPYRSRSARLWECNDLIGFRRRMDVRCAS